MTYDYDVIVIGGGPAGLSAAIRTRWIKQYKAVPCSTLVIEAAHIGGLAGWRGCQFAGPSWQLDREEILNRFQSDIHGLNIPVHRGRVEKIETSGPIKTVHTTEGATFRALCVIIATGIKSLVNERDFLGRGLEVTNMGYEAIVEKVGEFCRRPGAKRLAVVGSSKLSNLMPLIRKTTPPGVEMVFIMEENGICEGDVIRGWVEQYFGNTRIEGLKLKTGTGSVRLDCDAVLLDFNSYELAPACRISMDNRPAPFSFIPVDADMLTQTPGILAAGDITQGAYNSFSRAVSQGITAGLSAYRYVFEKKFNRPPPLFAYRPTDFILHADFKELPALKATMKPVVLCRETEIKDELTDDVEDLAGLFDGRHSMERISEITGRSLSKIMALATALVEKKRMTVHVEIDG
ncbi:MAG: NAD(P)/FAD-dependent oxidoreductase [Desulfobacterales bacterium]|jgi:thioredoxin reductase|nr:NAD(P)/FAD-dependent oxidoreductase [Desulfobacterales bacterium]